MTSIKNNFFLKTLFESYFFAKLLMYYPKTVNRQPEMKDKLQLFFFPLVSAQGQFPASAYHLICAYRSIIFVAPSVESRAIPA
ncbi:hypothetical protein CUN67_06330 [Pantoea cypripedii]|uniref:Uncharacterized protein n=1 Tax=Pantoea cypripedii TaxID=55209 RepID=A0A6B9G878_PANCY|nr:hypothetical protein CUN67_06330 [Pantoea cypripedii]